MYNSIDRIGELADYCVQRLTGQHGYQILASEELRAHNPEPNREPVTIGYGAGLKHRDIKTKLHLSFYPIEQVPGIDPVTGQTRRQAIQEHIETGQEPQGLTRVILPDGTAFFVKLLGDDSFYAAIQYVVDIGRLPDHTRNMRQLRSVITAKEGLLERILRANHL
ncbi:hypothetical protein HY640_04830 [Candidatus Woesearchaeota archaeon]|nr:hypothetical protein [Candidatus Woesearchaeota archaeon]